MDEKKLHAQEFQLIGIGGNMRCTLLQKRSTEKTTECSKHLRHIVIEKDINLTDAFFNYLFFERRMSLLVLCNFNFYFKIA